MTRVSKLTYRSMADQAAEALSAYIVSEGLQPGSVLPPEGKLAEQFGVSRPVIREALRLLAGTGAIEIVKGKGSVIRPIDANPLLVFFDRAASMDIDSIVELVEVRRGIELESVRLAALRRTEEEGTVLADLAERMRRAIDDPDTYAELDVEFHLAIAAASHNRMIRHLVSSLRGALHETIREGLRARRSRAQFERVQQLHEELCKRVVAGDAPGAQKAMTAHFEEAVDVLVHRRVTGAGSARRGGGKDGRSPRGR
jgi:DNA-binding FadR family transcriptional regulator